MSHLHKLLLGLGCAVLLAGVAEPAAANTYQLTFGASGFGSIGPGTPPVSFVLGQVTFDLDPSHDSTGSVVTDFINLAQGALGYTYSATTGGITIGGTINGVTAMVGGTDDLSLHVSNLNSVPAFSNFYYASVLSPSSIFEANNGSVHVDVASVASTPVPAGLPLFISALGGLGVLGWRRRNVAG